MDKKIVIPGSGISKPTSPHDRRMSRILRIPAKNSLAGLSLQRAMDRDLEFQFKWRDFEDLWVYRLQGRLHDGCGLHMAKILRWYLGEYVNRYSIVGPGGFPSSFNVLEAFMTLFEGNMLFDLRSESDHLVSISEYFNWYKSNDCFQAPLLLKNFLREGEIHSFNMMGGQRNLILKGDSEIKIAGISFIRHEDEVSCVMLAGENITDDVKASCMEAVKNTVPRPGREELLESSKSCDFKAEDSLLEGYNDLNKVIFLARIDLRDGRFETRGVQVDMGSYFRVMTDDPDVWDEERGGWEAFKNLAKNLDEYSNAFSALASLIYLPVYFSVNQDRIQNLEVYTELGSKPRTSILNKVIKNLGHNKCIAKREIYCLPENISSFGESPEEIIPPPIEMKSVGYWKDIAPSDLGEGKNGEKIFGRTWVTRVDNWVVSDPESFLVERSERCAVGLDPGIIYVQRCPGHVLNLYKIGLTRRTADQRSKELSSATGVPLPFDVLASWSVGDCARTESAAHKKMENYRINPRREFFRLELSSICKVIEQAIAENS